MKGNPTTKRLQQTRGMVSADTKVPESIRAMLSGDMVKLSSGLISGSLRYEYSEIEL